MKIWEPILAIGWPLAVVAVATTAWLVPSGGGAQEDSAPPTSEQSPSPAPEPTTEESSEPVPSSSATDAPPTESALEVLAGIPSATARAGDYDRDAFGPGWGDPDRNGCDARNDVLARDLTEVKFRSGTNDCVVISGRLADPYTGKIINFVKGNETSELVQIDHVVALSWAWGYGAWTWTDQQRIDFYSNPDNLLAVDGETNQSKSDSGPADWIPPNSAYRCEYAERFVAVIAENGLSLPTADRNVLRRVLESC